MAVIVAIVVAHTNQSVANGDIQNVAEEWMEEETFSSDSFSAMSSATAHLIETTVVGEGEEGGVVLRTDQEIVVYTVREDWEKAMETAGHTVVENSMSDILGSRRYYDLPDGTTDVGRFAIKLSAQGNLDNSLWIDSQNRENYEGEFSGSVNLKFYEFAGATICGFAGMWKQFSDGTQGGLRIEINGDVLNLSVLLQNYLNSSRFIGIVVNNGFFEIRFRTSKRTRFNLRRIQLSTSCGQLPTGTPTPEPTAAPTKTPTMNPSSEPSLVPSVEHSTEPSPLPSLSRMPSTVPSSVPSTFPSLSYHPSNDPTVSMKPSTTPTSQPSNQPTSEPTVAPSSEPSVVPSLAPTPLWVVLVRFFSNVGLLIVTGLV